MNTSKSSWAKETEEEEARADEPEEFNMLMAEAEAGLEAYERHQDKSGPRSDSLSDLRLVND